MQLDHLLLLSRGRVCYCGPAQASIGYFSSSLGLPVPQFVNPADFMLDLLTFSGGAEEEGAEDLSDEERSALLMPRTDLDLHDHFRLSDAGTSMAGIIEAELRRASAVTLPATRSASNAGVRDAVRTAVVLTHRTLLSTMRDRGVVVIRTGAAVLIGLLVGACFYQSSVGPRINALLFVMCVFALFCVPAISRYATHAASARLQSVRTKPVCLRFRSVKRHWACGQVHRGPRALRARACSQLLYDRRVLHRDAMRGGPRARLRTRVVRGVPVEVDCSVCVPYTYTMQHTTLRAGEREVHVFDHLLQAVCWPSASIAPSPVVGTSARVRSCRSLWVSWSCTRPRATG